jgi:hypothetical protein
MQLPTRQALTALRGVDRPETLASADIPALLLCVMLELFMLIGAMQVEGDGIG